MFTLSLTLWWFGYHFVLRVARENERERDGREGGGGEQAMMRTIEVNHRRRRSPTSPMRQIAHSRFTLREGIRVDSGEIEALRPMDEEGGEKDPHHGSSSLAFGFGFGYGRIGYGRYECWICWGLFGLRRWQSEVIFTSFPQRNSWDLW